MAIENKRVSKSSGSLDERELKKIQSYISDERDNLIFSLLYELGITVSEIADLRVSQVSLLKQKIFLQDRTVSFSKRLENVLRRYLGSFSPSEFLFFTRQSPKITPRRVQQLLKRVSQISGEDITPSLLRRKAISRSLKEGQDIEQVKEFFGLKHLRKKYFLTEDEFRSFYSSVGPERDRLLVSVLYEAGITLSQASGLRVSDIDLENDTIYARSDKRFSKQHTRECRISPELTARIRDFISRNSLVGPSFLFFTRQSSRLSERRIQQLLRRYSEMAGLQEVTPTVLRNSCIAHTIAERGISAASQEFGFSVFRIYEYGHLGFAASGRQSGKFGENASKEGGRNG